MVQDRSSDALGRGKVNVGKRGGLKARARRWVSEEEMATSRDGLTDQLNRVTEDTQRINRRKTADGRDAKGGQPGLCQLSLRRAQLVAQP